MKHPYLMLAVLALFCTCKKVTDKINSEKPFTLFVLDTSGLPQNKCFDRVWGLSRPNIEACTNYTTGIKLPMNITSDSSMFFFKEGIKTDTLIIRYRKKYEPGNGEFEVIFIVTNISSTFESFSQKCITDLTPECDGDQAHLSAVIYF